MTTIYDLREDQNNALVIGANKNLREYCPELIDEFGAIGSIQWWDNFDSGKITKKIIVGIIVSIAPDGSDDLGDVVTIQTSERQIGYDYDGRWKDPSVQVGARVEVTCIKSTVSTKYGPESHLVDVKIEVNNS